MAVYSRLGWDAAPGLLVSRTLAFATFVCRALLPAPFLDRPRFHAGTLITMTSPLVLVERIESAVAQIEPGHSNKRLVEQVKDCMTDLPMHFISVPIAQHALSAIYASTTWTSSIQLQMTEHYLAYYRRWILAVCATTRTSTRTVRELPNRSNSVSWSTRDYPSLVPSARYLQPSCRKVEEHFVRGKIFVRG